MSAFKSNSAGHLLSKDGHICTTCCAPSTKGVLEVRYQRHTGAPVLNTCTTFLGGTIGWQCGDAAYMYWTGRSPGVGWQNVFVDLRTAYADGQWSGEVEILCAAAWDTEAESSKTITVQVWYLNYSVPAVQIETGELPQQSNCPSNLVARIKVFADGTFTLNGP